MGGFKYKGKERGGGGMFLEKSYANERFTLMSGSTVRCFCRVCLNKKKSTF